MADDIVPELLDSINKEFDLTAAKSEILKKALLLMQEGKATFIDVNDFAVEIGSILAKCFSSNVIPEILPDGRMYFNIADRILNPTLQKNFDLISGFATEVQTQLNQAANIGIKTQVPEFSQDRVDGLVNRIASEQDFSAIKWILNEPVINFSQNIINDTIQKNVELQNKVGLSPKITRIVVGKACKWCQSLEGSYKYPDVPDDIYRRHERCRCIVTYNPGDGRKQNIWTRKWNDNGERAKIEARKQINLPVASGAKNYIRDISFDFLKTPEKIRMDEHAYIQYDAIKNGNQNLSKRKIFSNIGYFKEMNNFSKADVDIAFNHVFNDKHELHDGLGLFKPDYDMAQSWTRLINGQNIQFHDLILLRHERLEHEYMYGVDKLSYDNAHDKTDEKFNYKLALEKYKEGSK